MKKRTISAIILMALLIGTFVISSKLFGILMLILSLIGFSEFFDVKFRRKVKDKRIFMIKLLGMLMTLLLVLNNTFFKIDLEILNLLPILVLSIPVIFYNDNNIYNIEDFLFVLGIIYILGYAFSNIVYLRDTNTAQCIFIFVIAFITDTFAYIGGSLIGRRKLTSISPKKTIEGSVIGTIMGVVVGSVYYINIVGGVSLIEAIILCFVLTILSEIGDLMFSSIKRYFDKKDFSNLIPGHGGVLDRFDSVIYVSLGLSLLLGIL